MKKTILFLYNSNSQRENGIEKRHYSQWQQNVEDSQAYIQQRHACICDVIVIHWRPEGMAS